MNATLAVFIYRTLQRAASPLLLLYFLWRVLRDHRYVRRFHERLGFLPHAFRRQIAGSIWVHAVSVGEVLSILPLLRRLKEDLPLVPVFVSASTIAGRKLAGERLAGLVSGVFYAPIDYSFAVRRVLRTLRPALVVVAETEIWPNLFFETRKAGCGLMLVNGRISGQALPRYRRFRWFFRHILALPDRILAQSEANRVRFLSLGAPPERLTNAGNLKYDFPSREAAIPGDILAFLRQTNPDPIWIAASTMPPARSGDVDEDSAVLQAFAELASSYPRLLLILAPRKPDRFDAAAVKLAASGVPFVRRTSLSSGARLGQLPGVLLLDSIGELAALFTLDCVVFMGGSLAQRGGHNILEPGSCSRPLILGPHMENFQEIAAEFKEAQACVEIEAAEELAGAVGGLLGNPDLRARLGEKARLLSEARRGATARALEAILELRSSRFPAFHPPFPLRQLLWLLARVWGAGAAWNRGRNLSRRRRLSTPVVSVGNLSMGGSGKTPFVLWLARQLARHGIRAGILTRGYRRLVPEKETIVEPGSHLPVARTGDEARILIRAAVAPLGIGADRYSTGRALEQSFHPDVLLLDDGFQHVRLDRDLDIVLIDALDPFGGNDLFPLGRLREPLRELSRAGLVVITRAQPADACAGLAAELRRFNPHAPILRAKVVAESWVDCQTGREYAPQELPPGEVAAFCGLANPASFWNTLSSLGFRPVFMRSMGDHHRYRPYEVERLAKEAARLGATILLTTEKDHINLCESACDLAQPIRLFWLRIGIEVDRGEEVLGAVKKVLNRGALKIQ